MKAKKLLRIIAVCALMLPATAFAATINLGASSLNGSTVNDFSVDGLIDFDFIIEDEGQVVLVVDLTAAESAAGSIDLRFAGVAGIGLPGGLERLALLLGDNSFGAVGDAIGSDGADIPVFTSARTATFYFVEPENGVFTVGALGDGVNDWAIDFAAGATSLEFTFVIKEGKTVVPVPGAAWLFISAIAGLGALRRRKS